MLSLGSFYPNTDLSAHSGDDFTLDIFATGNYVKHGGE